MHRQQQKAVLVTELKQPVEIGTRDIPTPKEGQVLVKVTATMLLPHDAYGRDTGLFVEGKLPYILGANVAGFVEQADASTAFHKGDHVFGIGDFKAPTPDQQGLQEYAVLNVDAIAKVPNGVSGDDAVSLPVNLITSFMAFFDPKYGFNLPAPWEAPQLEDQTIVIIGGGSSTGKLAVQLAKLAGIGKVVTVAGLRNKADLERIGSAHVIDRHGSIEEITNQVHAHTGPDVTHVIDRVNSSFELATSLVSKTKKSTLVRFMPDYHPEILVEKRPMCTSIFTRAHNDNNAHKVEFWKHVPQWLAAGDILPTSYWTLDGVDNVDKINAVLDGYSAGVWGGRVWLPALQSL